MSNLGERILAVKQPCGKISSMRNQVCPCTGSLTSVASMVDAGNFVGFCSAGSFVLDLETNDIDWLERVGNTFEMELEILPCSDAKPFLDAAGFPGRP